MGGCNRDGSGCLARLRPSSLIESTAAARTAAADRNPEGIANQFRLRVVHGMVLDGNDREVIKACQHGEAEAFRALFEAHKDKVYSIALRFGGNSAVAMDIAQDVFLKLLSSIQEFRGDSSFDSWLYRLVINRCLDYQRRSRRLIPILEGLLDAVRSHKDSALDDLLRAETRNQVQQVVAKLPPDQRIVIVLRYTEGLSYDQIAEILDCSPGTVASRLNRAHKALERRLACIRR
jgi:RNA polymerase sigma-70 factor, ECF subfamily